MTEEKAIAGCKRADRISQKYLFDAYSDGMLMVCMRYVKHLPDAEEIMLNGFYNFFKSIDRFIYNGQGSIGGWLKKIMVNECLMFLRKKEGLKITDEGYAAEIGTEDGVIGKMSANEIFQLIMTLPVGYRTVFNLFVAEGYSHKEISELLGISEGTSKSQLSKAKAMMQKVMKEKKDAAMKNNVGDKLVSEKLRTLDTLSGGIVYGKEEAWEKLQARMEQKLVKRVPLKYWIAAAAMLLLFLCITMVYYYPEKQEVIIARHSEVSTPVNNIAVDEPTIKPVAVHPEHATYSIVTATNKRLKHNKPVIVTEERKPEHVVVITQPEQVPVSESKEPAIVSNATLPAPKVIKTMNVVHINDLDKPDATDVMPMPVANNNPPFDMSKLPVVHINDVAQQEYEVREILRENRLSIGHLFYPKNGYYMHGYIDNISIQAY